jgi:hypothetical protein
MIWGRLLRVGEWEVSWRSLVSLRRAKWFPKLVVHEKYEVRLKWALRLLAIVGILTSLVVFASLAQALLVALLLAGVELFLERAVIQYTALYVQPFRFQTSSIDRRSGMGWALPSTRLLGASYLL